MAGKAQLPKTSVDEIVKANSERKKQFGRERAAYAGVPQGISFVSGANASGVGGTVTSESYLRTASGTMMGPLAFFPRATLISSGGIDLAQTTTAFSSRVIVTGEGASADNLCRISNPVHAGQILFLQAFLLTSV